MKKKLLSVAALAVLTLGIAACGSSADTKDSGSGSEATTLKVGASPTPHAEILEHVKPLLAEEGIDLEIVKFDDYILPNQALSEGEIDANYFQSIPYFEKEVADKGYDFANAGNIHAEPMAIYSKTVTDINDVKDGATLITSNSESDWGRIIGILQDAGLITIKDGVDIQTATFEDIDENPKNLKFEHSIDASMLTTAYQNEEGDLVAINANYAVGIDLNPQDDSLAIQKDLEAYANIIAVRTEDQDSEAVEKLVAVLHQADVQEWIEKEFKGVVEPLN